MKKKLSKKERREYFEKNYNAKPIAEMAAELNCMVSSIYKTAYRFGLVKDTGKKFTKEEIEVYLRKNLNTKKIEDIAAELGYSTRQVFNLTKSLSLKKDNVIRTQTASINKKIFEKVKKSKKVEEVKPPKAVKRPAKTRAIKEELEAGEKAKKLKAECSAKAEILNDYTQIIWVTVGRESYPLSRAKYSSQAQIDSFITQRAEKQRQRNEQKNKALRRQEKL